MATAETIRSSRPNRPTHERNHSDDISLIKRVKTYYEHGKHAEQQFNSIRDNKSQRNK